MDISSRRPASRLLRASSLIALLLVALSSVVACSGADDAAHAPAADEAIQAEATDAGYVGVSSEFPTGSASISADGLVASYDMESLTVSGFLQDFSGNGHDGDFAAANLIDGMHGQARLYREVSDRVHLEASPQFDLDGPLTVAAWVRVDEPGLHQHVFACDDKWALWITPDDRFRLGDTQGGGWSTAPGRARQGEWVGVVAVLRGTRNDPLTSEVVSLHVDGELADASIHLRTEQARDLGLWNPGDLYPRDACYIGFESHQGMESHRTMPFVGAIDEVMLFSRAWSLDEVRAFSTRR